MAYQACSGGWASSGGSGRLWRMVLTFSVGGCLAIGPGLQPRPVALLRRTLRATLAREKVPPEAGESDIRSIFDCVRPLRAASYRLMPLHTASYRFMYGHVPEGPYLQGLR
ncbi:hypothetical protein GCM10009743_41960 [Kribbella swartbergensis]